MDIFCKAHLTKFPIQDLWPGIEIQRKPILLTPAAAELASAVQRGTRSVRGRADLSHRGSGEARSGLALARRARRSLRGIHVTTKHPGPFWGLLAPPGPSWLPWGLLDPPGPSCGLLALMGLPGASWALLKPPGVSWGLLGPSGASWHPWSLLGPPWPS